MQYQLYFGYTLSFNIAFNGSQLYLVAGFVKIKFLINNKYDAKRKYD